MFQAVKLVILTGMSGAGKTQAIKYLEDQGYFCVDNLPPALMPKLAELVDHGDGKVTRLALGIDVRGGRFFNQILSALTDLEKMGVTYQILFMDAADETLVKRYKESRRRHPLALQGRLLEGIRKERKLMQELRGRAHKIVDTTKLSNTGLRRALAEFFANEQEGQGLHVNVVSFGFKYGVVMDADLMFDVRFLPNPHYVEDLKALTGETAVVQEYVMKWGVTQQFFKRLTALVDFLLPQYVAEGKSQLTIAVGCTGGQHRSVCLAIKLGDWVRSQGYSVRIEHRDVPKDLLDESPEKLAEAYPILLEEAPETLERAGLIENPPAGAVLPEPDATPPTTDGEGNEP